VFGPERDSLGQGTIRSRSVPSDGALEVADYRAFAARHRSPRPLGTVTASSAWVGLSADGVCLRQNSGDASGQDVYYFHMHVVPRHEGDLLGRACIWGVAPWKPPKGGQRKRRQVADLSDALSLSVIPALAAVVSHTEGDAQARQGILVGHLAAFAMDGRQSCVRQPPNSRVRRRTEVNAERYGAADEPDMPGDHSMGNSARRQT
jgi:hypothetical protein